MGHDIGSPFEGTAQERRGKRIVNDKGKAVFVGHAGPALQVEHFYAGIGEGFAENQFGVGADGGLDLRVGGIGLEEGDVDAEFGKRDAQRVSIFAIEVRFILTYYFSFA